MTIGTTLNRVTYAGDGITTVTAYPFEIFLAQDLQVYDVVTATGVATVLALNTDYTVSGVGAPTGGNVTRVTATAVGHTLLIIRVEPFTQASALPSNDKFPTVVVEIALDKLTMLAQQLNETDARALKLAVTSLYSNIAVPDPVTGKFIRWKDTTALENADITSGGALGIPVSTANGGTGVNAASAAALAKALGLGLWGGSAAGSAALSIAAGVGTLPDPLTTNIFTVSSNLASLTPNPLVGTRLTFYWNAASVVVTHGSLILLNGSSNTFTTGEVSEFVYVGGGGWQEVARYSATQLSKPESGRLSFVSGTSLKFLPYKGQLLPVKTGGIWKLRDITSTGIASGNPTTGSNFVNGTGSQALAANTTYLVTVFDNAGTLTFDFLTTLTHTQDTLTGVEIKNADATRTVVGMIRTNATPNFVDSATQRFVISWFNRRDRYLTSSFSADRSTSSTSYVELNTEIRVEAVFWAEEDFHASLSGSASGNGANVFIGTSLSIDGGNLACSSSNSVSSSSTVNIGVSVESTTTEGYHYLTLFGGVNTGTGTWQSSDASVTGAKCRLFAMIRG